MTTPLSGSIANTIYNGMKSLFLDAILVRDVASSNSPDVDQFDPPSPAPSSYACKAIVDTYSEYTRVSGFASQSDRKIVILNKSLSVTPVPNDRIMIGDTTYTVLEVGADPALATWTCKARI